jgi:DNA-binding response OmpR family regulator
VLVADDEPSMLELVSRHLKSHDNPKLDILEASDGEQAWLLARERLPDLVVLDVMMPGMSGWEVCRKIREDVALAHTGVVMLTGIGENLNQMTSPLYGADAYIDKPFDFDDLDAKVKEALLARAALRGNVMRPALNGVAGPAKALVADKPAARKAGPSKKAAKKAAPKKAVSKKAAPKKAAKKAVSKKAAPKKAAPKKAVSKKAAPKKAAKKTVSKKAAPKKAAKKTVSKKAAPKKSKSAGKAKVGVKKASSKKKR